MRGFGIKLAVLATLLFVGRAEAVVIDFNNLSEGKIVQSSDLPAGFTISVNNRNANHPDKGIIFNSDCPPGNVGADCSGEDPDQITPGTGIGNNHAQHMTLIIAEDVVDTSPANGLVDDPDDEACGGTITFTIPDHCELRSLRLIDIDCNEEKTKVTLNLAAGGTTNLSVAPLGNNSAQTIEVPKPLPNINGFVVDCEGSCAVDDIVLDCCTPPTTTTSTLCTTTTTCTTTTSETTSTTTTTTTTTTIPPRCGDGKVDAGEQCDEGENNSDAPDATCRLNCTPQRCGDGIQDTGEECDDDGNNSDTTPDACRTDCTLPKCGDGVIDTGEHCDDGAANSDTTPNACRTDCTLPGLRRWRHRYQPLARPCDPPPKPNAENCANQLDDDGDGLIDCVTPPIARPASQVRV